MRSETIYVFARMQDGSSPIVGRLDRSDGPRGGKFGSFRYARSWRENAVSGFALDPENMPLEPSTFQTQQRQGMPGVIADALPDRWGRKLLMLEKPGVMSPMEMLVHPGLDFVGRLTFSGTAEPPASPPPHSGIETLDAIGEAFDRIERQEPVSDLMRAIYTAGVSIGGARPKAVVEHDGAVWLAKFQKASDEWDQVEVENATMRLCGAVGIDVPETRVQTVGSRKVLLVRRFDRCEGTRRPSAHFISGMSLLDVSDTSGDGTYPDLASVVRRHAGSHAARELFDRMVFNVIMGNRDDHLKNHAMLNIDGSWILSPAYDVLPQPDMEPVQAIGVGTMGGLPTIGNLLSRCADFSLRPDEAGEAASRVAEECRGWRMFFEDLGVDANTIDRVSSAIDPGIVLRRSPTPGHTPAGPSGRA